MPSAASHDACILCGSTHVELRPMFASMQRVTSDSRIWSAGGKLGLCRDCGMVQKPYDIDFENECEQIYRSYQLYAQSGGSEQKIFTAKGAIARSRLLIDVLLQNSQLPQNARILDVGCGAGNFLREAAAACPQWVLYGHDISDHRREEILSIPGVAGFYHNDLATIDDRFDIICLSHVLEHVKNPAALLRQLMVLLAPNGILLIAVPNWHQNAFDLLVADHCSHFSTHHLRTLLTRTDCRAIQLSADIIPKEIIALVSRDTGDTQDVVPKDAAVLDSTLDWLNAVTQWAITEGAKSRKIAIFGTAIAAAWLTHAAKLQPIAYVDEDAARHGRIYMDKPVLSPADIAQDTTVLIPLPTAIAERIASRLNQGQPHPVYLPPPPMRNI